MVATESSWFVLFVWNRWIRPGTPPANVTGVKRKSRSDIRLDRSFRARRVAVCVCVDRWWLIIFVWCHAPPSLVWFGRHCDWLLAASLLACLVGSLSLFPTLFCFSLRE